MKRIVATAASFAAAVAVADGVASSSATMPDTIPPAVYVTDFYAPPPDWVPQRQIREYSLNTRVPDLFWLKYGDAYALALRIRPIAEGQIAKDLEVKLIDPKRADDAKTFTAEREKAGADRVVGVFGLDVPADDFVEFSFKMKARTKVANPEVVVTADGVTTVSTAKDLDLETKCPQGFKAYKVPLQTKPGRKLRAVRISVPAAPGYDPDEEYVFADLCFRRAAPKPRFTDLPQRRWIWKAAFEEGLPLVAILENGFPPFYKPAGKRFDACAAGRLLLLAPWPHHTETRPITRAQCLALNRLAEEVCLRAERLRAEARSTEPNSPLEP